VAVLAIQIAGCVRSGADQSAEPYKPRPAVSLSAFNQDGRISSIYVRHSGGSALFYFGDEPAECADDPELKLILSMDAPDNVEFAAVRYENFNSSIDIHDDGRIVLVPLTSPQGTDLGVFVNLLSGKRYFFVPSNISPDTASQLRWLKDRWPGLTIISSRDRRAAERVARYPEFDQ
jgi:hypothetical protein